MYTTHEPGPPLRFRTNEVRGVCCGATVTGALVRLRAVVLCWPSSTGKASNPRRDSSADAQGRALGRQSPSEESVRQNELGTFSVRRMLSASTLSERDLPRYVVRGRVAHPGEPEAVPKSGAVAGPRGAS